MSGYGPTTGNGAMHFNDRNHRIEIVMPAAAKCRKCGGAKVFRASVGQSGFTAGSEHRHADDCSEVVCEHGIRYDRWMVEVCKPCDERHEREWEEVKAGS